MRKLFFLAVAVAVLGIVAFRPPHLIIGSRQENELSFLQRVLAASGAGLEEWKIESWAEAESRYLGPDELGQRVRSSVQTVTGAAPAAAPRYFEDEFFRSCSLSSEGSSGLKVEVLAQSLPARPEAGVSTAESYLLITVQGNADLSMDEYLVRVKDAYRKRGLSPRFSYQLAGALPGRMDSAEREQKVVEVLTAAGCKDISFITDGETTSGTGYSEHLSESIPLGQKRVNLNVALRYHESEGVTYVYLGSPLLGGEY